MRCRRRAVSLYIHTYICESFFSTHTQSKHIKYNIPKIMWDYEPFFLPTHLNPASKKSATQKKTIWWMQASEKVRRFKILMWRVFFFRRTPICDTVRACNMFCHRQYIYEVAAAREYLFICVCVIHCFIARLTFFSFRVESSQSPHTLRIHSSKLMIWN